MDRAVGGSPAPTRPSRLGAVRQRGVAIANLFGADISVYATPTENIRAAQAAADKLDNFEGEERRMMMERVQQLLDVAAAQNEAGCRTEAPQRQNDDPPPRRLAGPVERRTRSRLSATVGLASPSSATKTAAPKRWNGGTTICLPLLAEKGESPRRLWNIRLSVTVLAAERESERMTPATGSTNSTDPWRWKKKTSWVLPVLDPASEMSPSPKGSRSPETHPNTPAL